MAAAHRGSLCGLFLPAGNVAHSDERWCSPEDPASVSHVHADEERRAGRESWRRWRGVVAPPAQAGVDEAACGEQRFASGIAARQLWGCEVCRSSWCLFFRTFLLSGARVPQLLSSEAHLRRMDVARRSASWITTHAYSGEQTPLSLLSLTSKAILTRQN